MALAVQELCDRARALADQRGGRVLIAIVGAPGAGKSTLAETFVEALAPRAGLVPMDGFHYSQRMLNHLDRAKRKGAPDTFDAEGLAALLTRVRDASGPVFAPTFDRSIEEPIAAGTVVPERADIVIVEGNYLLLDDGAWSSVSAQFDEAWYLRIPHETRLGRLLARHMKHGRSEAAAREWVMRVDEANAKLIEATADRADLIL